MARSKHADKGVAMLMYDISWLLHGILYRNYPELPVTAGVGLGFWVVPSSHMLKTEFLCHFCGKGFSGAAIRDIGYRLDSNLSLISVRVDGCQPKGPRFDPRRGTEKVPR